MKKNKKIINVFVVVLLLMLGLTFVVNAEASGDYEYKVLNNETISITKYTGEASIVEIPSEIDGLKVTKIDDEAFKNNKFATSISIPDSVTEIGYEAFADCSNLIQLFIGDGITEIYDDAFLRSNQIEEVTIGKNLNSIGALYSFGNLKSITVDSENTKFTCENGVLFNSDKTILYKYPSKNENTDYVVPDSVVRIGHNAFYNAVNLETVALSDSLEEIGEYAFLRCTALKSIDIPKGVIELYWGVFANCKSLESVGFSYTIRTINEEAFAGCENIKDVYYNADEEFWNRVSILPGNSFLKDATIHYNDTLGPSTVVDSGECGAQGDNVTWELYDDGLLIISGAGEIKDGAHWRDYSQVYYENTVKSVEIGEGITGIGNSNFSGMSAIASIKLPDSLRTIGKNAFNSCYRLSEIKLPDALETISEEVFSGCGIKDITIPEGIRTIEMETFFNCEKLETVVLPEGLEIIKNSAFWECHNLKRVNFPTTLTKIDGAAFSHTSLENVILPESVNYIGAGAFEECVMITEIYIPGKNVTVHSDSFRGCINLTEVYVGKGVKFTGPALERFLFPFQGSLLEYIYFEDSYENYIKNNKYPYEHMTSYNKIRFDCNIVEKHKHSYIVYKIEDVDGEKPGKIYYSCECGSSCVEHVHTYINEEIKATLSSNGSYKRICRNCAQEFGEGIYYSPETIELKTTKYTYDGKAKKPAILVKDKMGVELKEGTDYTVKYDNGRKNPGKYKVTVTFIGKYEGEKTLYFSILPGKTSSITATQNTSAIKLTWKKVTGATGYRVYQYNSKTGKYEKIKTITATSYTVKKLKAGTTYKFAVKAYTKDDGETLWAASYKTLTTATKPATPTVKAAAGNKKATISWNKVTGATGYVVYMQDEFGDYNKIGSIKKTSYTRKKLTKGETYYFRVRAYKTVGGKNIYGGYRTVKVKIK